MNHLAQDSAGYAGGSGRHGGDGHRQIDVRVAGAGEVVDVAAGTRQLGGQVIALLVGVEGDHDVETAAGAQLCQGRLVGTVDQLHGRAAVAQRRHHGGTTKLPQAAGAAGDHDPARTLRAAGEECQGDHRHPAGAAEHGHVGVRRHPGDQSSVGAPGEHLAQRAPAAGERLGVRQGRQAGSRV